MVVDGFDDKIKDFETFGDLPTQSLYEIWTEMIFSNHAGVRFSALLETKIKSPYLLAASLIHL